MWTLDSRDRRLRRRSWTLLAVLCLTALGSAAVYADEKADTIAAETLTAMGGREAYDNTRFLSFRFAGFRNHHWDKWTGRHRVEFTNRKGEHFVVLQNVNTKVGRAWMNGTELTGEEAKKAVEAAYGTWINDTYWLLMPYKLRDPGVTLSWDGEEVIDGVTYDKLHLKFASVGLTPGDQYWAYINRQTKLMDRWAYVLQDFEAGRPPTVWKWGNWQRFGGIQLASDRTMVGDEPRQLPLDNIAVASTMADSIFESGVALAQPPKP